jgi:hypothetical protein
VQSLFTGPAVGDPQKALAEIRSAMLQGLGQSSDKTIMAVQRKIAYAHGFQDLWYLRGDVLAAIALVQGEAVAKQEMAAIKTIS